MLEEHLWAMTSDLIRHLRHRRRSRTRYKFRYSCKLTVLRICASVVT